MDRDDAILDYLQDRMSREDRTGFEAMMAQDAALAAEVEVMRSVRAALAEGPVHANKEAVWDRLSNSMADRPEPANTNRAPWAALLRYAAVAAVAVSVWQFGVVPRMASAPDGFRPASQQTDALRVQVKFNDGVAFTEIAALLYSVNGTIVDGPGALGFVHLSFVDVEARAQAVAVLEVSDLVDLVQTP